MSQRTKETSIIIVTSLQIGFQEVVFSNVLIYVLSDLI